MRLLSLLFCSSVSFAHNYEERVMPENPLTLSHRKVVYMKNRAAHELLKSLT